LGTRGARTAEEIITRVSKQRPCCRRSAWALDPASSTSRSGFYWRVPRDFLKAFEDVHEDSLLRNDVLATQAIVMRHSRRGATRDSGTSIPPGSGADTRVTSPDCQDIRTPNAVEGDKSRAADCASVRRKSSLTTPSLRTWRAQRRRRTNRRARPRAGKPVFRIVGI
jgi:hypothetical protein